jgi:putative holliday junction resolvase
VRALGLDLGSKRIGVAVSDRSGTIATPLLVLPRTKSRKEDHRAIAALVAEEEAEHVVVGLPLSLDGTLGPAARAMQAEADELRAVLAVPVESFDERLTTVTADRALMEARMRAEARRRVVDKVAAAVMLQAWLDRRRSPARRLPENGARRLPENGARRLPENGARRLPDDPARRLPDDPARRLPENGARRLPDDPARRLPDDPALPDDTT